MDPVPASQSSGQISADGQFRWDGQQWVPLGAGRRVPTPWTRPMQLAAAGFFALSAISGLVITLAFVNHDSVLRAVHAQGGQIPTGTDIDTIINATVGLTYGVAIFFAAFYLVAAVGSFLAWRWMFWAVFVLCGLSTIGGLINLRSFANVDQSPVPVGGLVVDELIAMLGAALFVWMLVGLVKYGPWAMKRPGT
ncbi:MAG TPA: hypothetical protein DCF65_07465 [Chloroflexi bacterium]|jgi:hypothetical protein|nr:hypothetical protein [Chloroflexota bacterium]HAF18210.1 hypothetical protein [Chloroflexota bacterium]